MRILWVYFQNEPSDLYLNECGIQAYALDEVYKYRVYQNFVLHYVISGKGYFEVNNQVYHLKAGDGYIIRKSDDVHYYPDSQDPWTTCWIGINGLKMKDYLSPTQLWHQAVIHFDTTSHASQLITEICYYTQKNEHNIPHEFWYKSQLYLLLYYLKREFSTERSSITMTSKSFAEVAYDYISNNYMNVMTIEDVAEFIGISRSYLYKLFKKEYGISPQQLLLDKRITIASSLLQTTQFTIAEISEKVGFKDALYFSRSFSKYYNESPSQFRKRHDYNNFKEAWEKFK